MNENDHLIASLTHNSTEFHQALPNLKCLILICVSGKTANYKDTFGFVIRNLLFSVRCFFKVVYLSEVVFVALDLFHGIFLYTGTPGQPPPQTQYRDVPVS